MAVTLPTLVARQSPLASSKAQRSSLQAWPIAREFGDAVRTAGQAPLRAAGVSVLQINVGKLCNQTCRHCHVDAGPDRREIMSRETMACCLAAIDAADIPTVDITGGAPELNPDFRWLVRECAARGRHVMDRCNLTIIETGPGASLPAFFAEHRVEVICSLPHYRATNTDAQRGDGVFDRSIAALKKLNAVGYGDGRSGLRLALVTNPVGAFLPPAQASLEAEWKHELFGQYGVRFDALYGLANMPIGRYLEWLLASGNAEQYMARLVAAFNPHTVDGLMCRTMVSVGWDGSLYDCDFNQMLELPVSTPAAAHIRDFDAAALATRPIVIGRHCFGCTAGAGSSCGGSLV